MGAATFGSNDPAGCFFVRTREAVGTSLRVYRLALLCSLVLLACPAANPPVLPEVGAPVDGGDHTDGGDDAGSDGGDDGGLQFLDWRDVRGEDLPTTSLELNDGSLYGATSEGYILRTNCDGGACDYAWHQQDGGLLREGSRWLPLYPTWPESPEGSKLLLLETRSEAACPESAPMHHGELRLINAETGEALFTEPDVSLQVIGAENAFTSRGGLFRTFFATACDLASERVSSTTPPYALAPGVDSSLYLEEELPDGRAVGWQNGGSVVLVNPQLAGSVDLIAADATGFDLSGGWVHAYLRSPLQQVIARSDLNGRHVWQLSDEEWYPAGAWGRWVLACGRPDVETHIRPCVSHDLQGEHADVHFESEGLMTSAAGALAGKAHLVVVPTRDAAGGKRLERVDLISGERPQVGVNGDRLLAAGDGDAVIVYGDAGAFFVEAGSVTKLTDGIVTSAYGITQPASGLELPQRALAVLIRVLPSGAHSLVLINVATRQVVTLSDRLYWAPELGAGFAQESCGRPWVTRSKGSAARSLAEPARDLYFVEQPPASGEATLWMLPLDFSSAPRALSRMVPIYCHAPYVSADGTHVAAEMEGWDGAPRRWVRQATLR